MNIDGVEYVEKSAFVELHKVNMRFVDEVMALRAELAEAQKVVAAAKEWTKAYMTGQGIFIPDMLDAILAGRGPEKEKP